MFVNKLLKKIKDFTSIYELLLIGILCIAAYLTYYPHFNYPYLFHVDEWFHIARAKQIALGTEIDWYGIQNLTFGLEQAWHIILAVIYYIFRLNIFQWTFIPLIIHLISVNSVYLFMVKLFDKKNALISALLIAILPSNVTMGGPVFIIPLNLSLIFIPIALLFAFELTNLKKIYNYLILVFITTFLLYAHPPSAIVLLGILCIYLFLNLFSDKEECKNKAKIIFLSIISAVFFSLPRYLMVLAQGGIQVFTFDFWINLQGIPIIFGFIPTAFFIIGFYFHSTESDKRVWAILLTTIALLVNLVIFSLTGTNYILPYVRTHIPLLLLMSLIASKGYLKILNLFNYRKNIGLIILVVLLIVTMALAIPKNIETNYYQIIDDEDYESFIWIKENTNEDIIVLSDPWIARALAPIAERRVYSVMPFGPNEEPLRLVYKTNIFFNQNCTNTSFLIDNNIDYVYTKNKCDNDYLVEVYNNIYQYKQG